VRIWGLRRLICPLDAGNSAFLRVGGGRRGGEMVQGGEKRHFFPLTSLQIGDLQSYLAELTIFLCPHTKKFLILLDNRPWLLDQGTKPAHLWQLMVTKVHCLFSLLMQHFAYCNISFSLKFHYTVVTIWFLLFRAPVKAFPFRELKD
jgi:hypothetical protein